MAGGTRAAVRSSRGGGALEAVRTHRRSVRASHAFIMHDDDEDDFLLVCLFVPRTDLFIHLLLYFTG